MNKTLLLLMLFAFITSCGVKLNKAKGLEVSYRESSTGTPIDLEDSKIFSVCKPSLDKLITASVFTGSEFKNIPYQVKSELFPNILYAGDIDLVESSIGMRGYRKDILDNGKIFSICLGADYSSEKSYESAAASSLFSFSKTQVILDQLKLNLPPLTLRIAPKVTRTKEYNEGNTLVRDSKILINNAYYNYKEKEIVFLPQGIPSKSGIIPFSGVAMWNIPFVGAHEYGHHLFASLFSNFVNDSELSKSTKFCFDNSHKHDQNIQKFSNNNKSRVVGVKEVVTVINEAAADMFARYVVDEQITMKNLGCLRKSRDVKSKSFTSGATKRLSSKMIEKFFLGKHIQTQNCYREVNYQDPHMIGASIAYMFDQILSEKKQTKEEKIQFLVNWIKELNLKYYSYKYLSNQKILEEMTLIGLNLAKAKFELSQSKTCAIIGMNYPGLHSYYSCK
jgi:hypothetical protein